MESLLAGLIYSQPECAAAAACPWPACLACAAQGRPRATAAPARLPAGLRRRLAPLPDPCPLPRPAPSRYDAYKLHDAISGAGTDDAVLIQHLTHRTNEEVAAINAAYLKASRLQLALAAWTPGWLAGGLAGLDGAEAALRA